MSDKEYIKEVLRVKYHQLKRPYFIKQLKYSFSALTFGSIIRAPPSHHPTELYFQMRWSSWHQDFVMFSIAYTVFHLSKLSFLLSSIVHPYINWVCIFMEEPAQPCSLHTCSL